MCSVSLRSTLTLFMFGMFTNNINPAFTPDNFTVFTNFFNRRPNFHRIDANIRIDTNYTNNSIRIIRMH